MVSPQPEMRRAEILAGLTPTQCAAVQHVDGPLLILAGPGSGKTRVVTHRIAYLLSIGVPDSQIAAVTFTNKAADEMRDRVNRLAPNHGVWLGTFHRFCSRLLRRYGNFVGVKENFSILDTDDSRKLLMNVIRDQRIDRQSYTPGQIAQAISFAKNEMMTPEQYEASQNSPLGFVTSQVYPEYQQRLLIANAVDFDDLLLHAATLLRENPELRASLDQRFRFIMVDEYQDTNLAQYAIARALSVDHPNLAVTGDPDQSIYGWRGAAIRNILDFERDFDEVCIVKLEQNYRSTQNILDVADVLIAHNSMRKEKTLFTDNAEGRPVQLAVFSNGLEEAETIAARIANEIASGNRNPRDFAIFYRINALTRPLERAFKRLGIPYQVVRGVEFYQRKEVKDILAYLHLINNPANDAAFLRVINTPRRGIGKVSIDRLAQHATRYGIPLLDAARESGLIETLTKRSAVKFAQFVAMYDRLCAHVGASVTTVLQEVLDVTQYETWLEENETDEDQSRLDNVQELLTDAQEFDLSHPEDGGLEAFLENVSLVADSDDLDSDIDRVTLMTLHAAKGLEFPVVFIVAVEEDILPHQRSKEDAAQIEEERRLLFVGITRAKEELQISAAQRRGFRGDTRPAVISQFLMELPHEKMQVFGKLHYRSADFEIDRDWCQDADFDADDEVYTLDGNDSHSTNHGESDEGSRQACSNERSAARRTMPAGLHTASAMAGETNTDSGSANPQDFVSGILVSHPEYGVGKVVKASGAGKNRTVNVRFVGPAGEKSFRVAFSPLRPVTR
jgi:DNA helicase-2/ATP-dependent DNA helicase PcrA